MKERLGVAPVLLVLILSFFASAGFARPYGSGEPFLVFQTEDLAKKPDQPEAYDINYSYDPGGRRDPFASLVGGMKRPGTVVPKGALSVDDAKIVGITRNKDTYVAIIMGSDKKARFMKAGDKLYDGEILSIESDRVTFRQDLTEDLPSAPGLRSKEVVKRLHPVQEGT